MNFSNNTPNAIKVGKKIQINDKNKEKVLIDAVRQFIFENDNRNFRDDAKEISSKFVTKNVLHPLNKNVDIRIKRMFDDVNVCRNDEKEIK